MYETGKPTNWYVITGAPCSGKTAVIDHLAGLGYRTVPEVARAYIESQLTQGRTLANIKADLLAFERHILMEKVRIESALPHEEMIFFDRAVPDSIAYYQLEGLSSNEPVELSRRVRYRKVFLFDPIQFEKDGVRTENQTLSDRIHTNLDGAYTALGYEIIQVPVMRIERRVQFVLSHCAGSPANKI